MKILGLSCFYHDSAAALIGDGQPMAAVQEERFSRLKNDSSFPFKSIEFCLNTQNLSLSSLDAVVFYEKPLLKLDRQLETFLQTAPLNPISFVDSFTKAVQKTLFLRRDLTEQLQKVDPQFNGDRLLFSEHHLSHAASAYFPSPFESAAVLTMDGIGEWATTTLSYGQKDQLLPLREIHFPHSLGLFYSAMTAFCGFKVNSGEYKLMGLAPYGTPRFRELILENLIALKDDGSFRLGLEYFDFLSTKQMFSAKMSSLFKTPPREPESVVAPIYMDIAASTQMVLNEAVLNLTKCLAREYPNNNLCLAGGVALNCVSNSQIIKQGLFKKIWIQPASGDAGGALGAALAAHCLHFKKPRYRKHNQDSMSFAYLGTEYTNPQILAELQNFDLKYTQLDQVDLIERTSQSLASGLSVGWFQGRMEFGPRSLGARSILADARAPHMHKKLNLQIKFRESFRPFAPLILKHKVKDWFSGLMDDSPYMLFVDTLKTEKQFNTVDTAQVTTQDSTQRIDQVRSAIPAVTHLDYSARLQTLSESQNPLLYKVLERFDVVTGVPVLVNTSFNVRGEPIVESPKNAIECFLKTDLDLLVIGDFFVEKK